MDVWIAALAGSSLPLVVVPGGGPFADAGPRRRTARLGFSDAAAHAMAILAMEQFGQVILDRHESAFGRPARRRDRAGRWRRAKSRSGCRLRWSCPAPDIPHLLGRDLGLARGVARRQARRQDAAADQAEQGVSPRTTVLPTLWRGASSMPRFRRHAADRGRSSSLPARTTLPGGCNAVVGQPAGRAYLACSAGQEGG